jgi:hypothetical protein
MLRAAVLMRRLTLFDTGTVGEVTAESIDRRKAAVDHPTRTWALELGPD